MPRVKGGYVTRRRRKAVLKLAKGYYGSKHLLYKTAHEQVMRSLAYAYRDRKDRKRQFRKLWIARINAAAQLNGLKYSRFINGLAKANIDVNRKMLAEMAVNDAAGFANLCEIAKKALTTKTEVKVENVVVLTKAPKAAKPAVVEVKPAKVEKAVKEVAPKATKEVVAKVEKTAAPKVEVKEATTDLNSLTLPELKAMAKEKGITGISTMKKAELIEALK